jgi:two-component system, OmpR family, phosphate regulon sensor histidine kinase PhoR
MSLFSSIALSLFIAVFGYLIGHWFGAFCALLFSFIALWIYQSKQSEKLLTWLRSTENQQPPRLNGLLDDVVDRVYRQQRVNNSQLAEAENNLQSFLNAMQASPDGVMILNYFNSIQWCNHIAETHFGLDATRDQNQIINNLIRDPVFTDYLSSNNYGQGIVITGHGHQVDRPVKIALQIYPYGEDAKLLLSRNVTAIEQAEAMRRDFVANVSHEIRTPLTVLGGFIETFQNTKLSEKDQQHYLGLMAQQSTRMQDLTQDLLTLSKLEGSPPPNKDAIFGLNDLINTGKQDGLNLIKTLKLKSTFNVEINDHLNNIKIMGVLPELQSALSNLIGNAIRYTPNGGLITLTCTQLESQFEIAVSDNGHGIEPQHLARLTERFYRVDSSRSRESGGTGLGLAIVKHVMLRHNGELRIESIVGKGSKFALLLPNSRVKIN